ncbi:MAG TPA: NAD(+) diphosphatase [Cellvibrionaceae bacterium]
MFELSLDARFWCVHDNRILCDATFTPLELNAQLLAGEPVVHSLPVVAHRHIALLSHSHTVMNGQWCGLRELLNVVDEEYFALLGRAMQLAHWAETLRYCGRCGSALPAPAADRLASGEYVKNCSNCDYRAYPIISPCVIVLVTRGEQCLLAHHRRSGTNMYTALAGFIEPGESAEQTLRREVSEEVGIHLGTLYYMGSQSWPFPAQLMLGFYAQYQSGDIVPDNDEIVAAQWFDYHNLPEIPPVGTISRRLIDGFVDRCQKDATQRASHL